MTTIADRVDLPSDVTSFRRDPYSLRLDQEPRVEAQTPDREVDLHQPAGLPRQISGGFAAVAEDLERRGRDWTMMVRLLEQQRLHLETAERERTRLYETLESILPEVRRTGETLETSIETTKSGDVSANLSALFVENLRALDELENTAKALTANLLWTRSSWEQYARSVIGGQKMREELNG
ncbi:hypothetical protein [uncultured Enterovirga sp.]|uniref:hypothetical protein n=1 Tax=uncultured Enterovirga sp. TaxID=2026352 RepID=UPI0035CAC212